VQKLSLFKKIFGTTRRQIIYSIIAILTIESYIIARSYDPTRQKFCWFNTYLSCYWKCGFRYLFNQRYGWL